VHYVSTCAGGKISRFAVADVSGHGAGVDEVAQSLRRLMRRYIDTPDQSRFARELNAEFSRVSEGGVFATALLATYFAPTRQLIVVNAGHPRPMIRRAATGAWSVLDAADGDAEGPVRNLPLGIIDPTEYVQFAVTLAPGDEVVIVTDALVEARRVGGGMVGEAGLVDVVRGLPEASGSARAGMVISAIEGIAGGGLDDDVTVVWLRHTGERPRRKGLGEQLAVYGRMLGLTGPI
jgi:serine phosphatase RsbU (regulator of sigma subunit)